MKLEENKKKRKIESEDRIALSSFIVVVVPLAIVRLLVLAIMAVIIAVIISVIIFSLAALPAAQDGCKCYEYHCNDDGTNDQVQEDLSNVA